MIFLIVSTFVWGCAHEHRCPWRVKASDALELELEALVRDRCSTGEGRGGSSLLGHL